MHQTSSTTKRSEKKHTANSILPEQNMQKMKIHVRKLFPIIFSSQNRRETENSNLNNPGNSAGNYVETKHSSLPADFGDGRG